MTEGSGQAWVLLEGSSVLVSSALTNLPYE